MIIYIVLFFEFIVYESFDYGSFSSAGITQQYDFKCSFSYGGTRYGHLLLEISDFIFVIVIVFKSYYSN